MKNIVIFGTGAAGRAIHRAVNDRDNIVAFIDNNKQKQGSKYMDIPIYSVDEIVKLEFDYIYIGGIWVDEMEAQLANLGLKDKIKLIEDRDISFSTPDRERLTDEVMRILDRYFNQINMDYFICNSGLISILRNKALSVVSDVDLYVLKYSDLEYLARNLPDLLGSKYQVNLRYIQDDGLNLKAGDIKRITITNSDGVVIDIGLFDNYGKFKVCDYDDGRFFYFPNEIFDGGLKRLNYKDFSLSVLKNYHQYLCFMYGDNYIEVPKRFSSNDYLNLKTKSEIDSLNI